MSARLKKHAKTLKFLAETDHDTAKALIKTARPNLVNCFSEICHNLLKANIKLSAHEKKKLTKFKQSIRAIAKKSTKTPAKKRYLQRGGFLGALLPIIGSLIPKKSTKTPAKKRYLQRGGFLGALLPIIGSLIPTVVQGIGSLVSKRR